jgi:hypothetical protein
MMLTGVGIIIMVGAVLSCFSVVILVLAISIAPLGVAAVTILHGPTGSVPVAIVLIVLALQAGYLAGVITRILILGSMDAKPTKNWAFPRAQG